VGRSVRFFAKVASVDWEWEARSSGWQRRGCAGMRTRMLNQTIVIIICIDVFLPQDQIKQTKKSRQSRLLGAQELVTSRACQ
jgi:uncharacterized protein YecE (DUF72 family)